jgi:hypothetical protein
MSLLPLKDRFVRLHAGAVCDGSGRTLLVLGESGFGKSTLCSQLVIEHGFRLLSDEDVFIHRRTRIVEPFPVAHAPWKQGLRNPVSRSAFQPGLVAPDAGIVAAVLHLQRPEEASSDLLSADARSSLRSLLQGQRPGGSTHTEGIATLVPLAQSVPAYRMAGGSYQRLLDAAPAVARLVSSKMCQPSETL